MPEAYLNPPKFQLSKFLGANKEYQIVVRTQTAQELIDSMRDIKSLIEGIDKKASEPAQKTGLQGHCDLHNIDMKRFDGQYGEFWSHMYTDENGNKFFCDGKKLKPAKPRA